MVWAMVKLLCFVYVLSICLQLMTSSLNISCTSKHQESHQEARIELELLSAARSFEVSVKTRAKQRFKSAVLFSSL